MTQTAVAEAADYVGSRIGSRLRVALVLGTGLGALAARLQAPVGIPYAQIPHFPASTAPGHAGRLVSGILAGLPVIVMQGRFHSYEGYELSALTFAPRVLHALGAAFLMLTNAAGGVNLSYAPGDFMLISDHINLAGDNPLRGEESLAFGPRFPDLSGVYDPKLRALARRSARENGMTLREGVYGMFSGPSFETPAEIRMARALGADAVGMSTVPEAIAGIHCGMRVIGISLIANMAAGILPQPITAKEVMAISVERGPKLVTLITGILRGVKAWEA